MHGRSVERSLGQSSVGIWWAHTPIHSTHTGEYEKTPRFVLKHPPLCTKKTPALY